MTDTLQPVTLSSTLSSTPNFPMPSTAPVVAPKRSLVLPLMIALLAVSIITGGVYYFISNRQAPVTVAEVDSNVTATPFPSADPLFYEVYLSDDTVLLDIYEITAPIKWSEPIASSMKDANGNEVKGVIMTTPPVKVDDSNIARILTSDSDLVTKYGWTKSDSESNASKYITVYQRDTQILYIKYQFDSYYVLLKEK